MEFGLIMNNLDNLSEDGKLIEEDITNLPNGYLLIKQGKEYIVKDKDTVLFSTLNRLILEGQFLVEYTEYDYSIHNINNPKEYKSVQRFKIQDNLAIIQNNYFGLIDTVLNYVLPPIYRDMEFGNTQPDSIIINGVYTEEWLEISIDKCTSKPNYINSYKLRDGIYKKAVTFTTNEYLTEIHYKLFDNNISLSKSYEDIIDMYKALDYIIVVKNGCKGIIDTKGREVLKPIYKEIYHVCDKLFIVQYSNSHYNVFIDGRDMICNKALNGMTRNEIGVYYLYLNKDNGEKEWFIVGNKEIYQDILKAFPLKMIDSERDLYSINIYGSNKIIDRNFNEQK